jgi:hypothetical protein
VTEVGYQSVVAFETGLNVGTVGYVPHRAIRAGHPIVLFEPPGYGWHVRAIHTLLSKRAQCAGMHTSTSVKR